MKSSMKLFAALLILVFLLSACGKTDSGITGKMVLAKCSGSEVATDCVEQSTYAGSLTIYDEKLNKLKTVKTNGDGTFTIGLEPGTYFIHPENNGTFPMAADFKVVVKKGELTQLTIYYDTGLRENQPTAQP